MSTPLITLTTDFGSSDSYVGQMKGVIHSIAPTATVIDLTHDIPPQDVVAGSITIDDALDAFSPDTVHIIVVDPGVGTTRRAIAIQTAQGRFIAPDNGILTPILARDTNATIINLNNKQFHRKVISSTFHGRDIFAPTGAHLAAGASIDELGEPVSDPVRLDLPTPTSTETGLELHVLWIDHFGNCFTDLKHQDVEGRAFEIFVGDKLLNLGNTFADVSPNEAIAYIGSSGRLEIAVRDGSAAKTLGMNVGDAIQLSFSPG